MQGSRSVWVGSVWWFTFLLYAPIALWLGSRGILDRTDLLFDADCGWYREGFAEGGTAPHGSFGGRSWVHPNVYNLVHPPIAWLGTIATCFAGHERGALTRRTAVLLVAPIAGATRTAFVFRTLLLLHESLPIAIAGSWLGIASFSGTFFGVIPESFGLSGAAYAWLLYLAVLALLRGRESRLAWLTAGTLLVGFTITNVLAYSVLVVFVAVRRGRSKRAAVCRAVVWTTVVCISAGAVFVTETALERRFSMVRASAGQLHELRPSLRTMVWRFPRALVHTIVPAWPRWMLADLDRGTHVRVVRLSLRDDLDAILDDDPRIEFVPPPLGPGVDVVAAAFVVLAIGFALQRCMAARASRRHVFEAAFLLLGVSWAFHSLFGLELFLYSQHWFAPWIVLVTSGLTLEDREAPMAFGLVAALATLAAHQTAWIVRFIADLRL